ncbi:MAG: Stp1/IreP family PP2C-type Ser/Thr phosphatase [Acidobacteria bacterium]|nr:Stp1/IreP family PP2C-type Ser/Thr phosphatase [Acidobacteriota bacterium]
MKIRRGIVLSNLTDIGLERGLNEDYYGYFEPEDETLFARKGRLVIVADGMGGHQGGEVASQVAFEMVRDAYFESPEEDPRQALVDAFQSANGAIYDLARSNSALEGMGTTCSALLLKDDQAFLAHVGDSRIYLTREGKILQLTQDHSVVMDKVREGVLTEAEARHHAERNLINRAIGVAPTVEVDVSSLPIPTYEGDIFVLCSDGLSTLVAAEEIRDVVANQHPQDACKMLVELAKSRGGYDNITIQIVKLADELKKTKEYEITAERGGRRRKRLFKVLIAALILALILTAGLLYLRKLQRPRPATPGPSPPKQTQNTVTNSSSVVRGAVRNRRYAS